MSKDTFYNTINTFWGYNNQKLINAAFDPDVVLNDVYYDGELIAYLLADYFGTTDPYYTYADNANEVYQQNYAIPSSYQLPGFFCFAQGWTEGFIRRGIVGRASGVDALMASDGGRYMFPPPVGLNAEGRTPETRHEISREFAYSIINLLQQSRIATLSGAQISMLNQRVTDSLTIIDDWCGTMQASYFRPFMGSITMHALIDFSKSSFASAGQIADILTSGINLAAYAMNTCWDEGVLAFNYTDRDVGNPDDLIPQPTLNMLIAPWFAWLWTQSFNVPDKTQAEKIFQGGEPHYSDEGFWESGAYLGAPNPSGVLGKEVNQQLVWGYQYFNYIETIPPPAPPVGLRNDPSSKLLFNPWRG